MGDFCIIFNTILMSIIMIMASFIVFMLKGKPNILILNTPDRIASKGATFDQRNSMFPS
jgi:hypothetical protein